MTTLPHSAPFDRFGEWLTAAEASEPNDANAMGVATVGDDGQPSLRVVLLKAWDERGFVFYTNLDSHKGRDLAGNPRCCLNLHWKSLRRQVRISGSAALVEDAEADAYFATRPRLSQLSAWASRQSRPLAAREDFEAAIADMATRFPGDVPRPPRWSGWRVMPQRIEFWQDREGRSHEREVYDRQGDGWTLGLLYP